VATDGCNNITVHHVEKQFLIGFVQ